MKLTAQVQVTYEYYKSCDKKEIFAILLAEMKRKHGVINENNVKFNIIDTREFPYSFEIKNAQNQWELYLLSLNRKEVVLFQAEIRV